MRVCHQPSVGFASDSATTPHLAAPAEACAGTPRPPRRKGVEVTQRPARAPTGQLGSTAAGVPPCGAASAAPAQ